MLTNNYSRLSQKELRDAIARYKREIYLMQLEIAQRESLNRERYLGDSILFRKFDLKPSGAFVDDFMDGVSCKSPDDIAEQLWLQEKDWG